MNTTSAERTRAREGGLNAAFVALSDTLSADFDIVDLSDRLVRTTVDVLAAAAAGLMLDDQHSGLAVLASSSEQLRLLELFEVQNNDGPGLECFVTGEAVRPTGLDAVADLRWPGFTPAARDAGFTVVQALPLRLRSETIGALNVLYSGSRPAPDAAADTGTDVAQSLADVATIGILNHRAVARADESARQLQAALDSRVVIEQAKGVLAERGDMSVSEAFEVLRSFCRARRLPLSHVAGDILNGAVGADDVLADRWPSSPPG